MRHKYFTVKNPMSISLEINKSVFIAHTARTETAGQALAFLSEIRKRHSDATHNCFACIAGPQNDFQKSDDDGEPVGTSGKPILEVIRKNNLCDISIVVTRYFGGIKLGSGGLIRAYGKSASAVVQASGIVNRVLHSRLGIEIDYPLLGALENQLRQAGFAIADKLYAEQIRLIVLAEVGQELRLQKLVRDLSAGTACFSDQGVDYVEVDY